MTGLIMKYFTLNPKGNNPYAKASRRAMYAYAQSIEGENAELAKDLFTWWDRERKAALVDSMVAPAYSSSELALTAENCPRVSEEAIFKVIDAFKDAELEQLRNEVKALKEQIDDMGYEIAEAYDRGAANAE